MKNMKNGRSGFTMVELLAVIMVIGILAGMILGIAGIATKKAAEGKAQGMYAKIEMAIAEYQAEHRTYPLADDFGLLNLWDLGDDGELYRKLRPYIQDDKNLTGGSTSFGSAKFVDPWGRAVRYRTSNLANLTVNSVDFRNTMHNGQTYDLLMTGPDGVEYTGQADKSDDDIKNW